jgi:hypothetical protein
MPNLGQRVEYPPWQAGELSRLREVLRHLQGASDPRARLRALPPRGKAPVARPVPQATRAPHARALQNTRALQLGLPRSSAGRHPTAPTRDSSWSAS